AAWWSPWGPVCTRGRCWNWRRRPESSYADVLSSAEKGGRPPMTPPSGADPAKDLSTTGQFATVLASRDGLEAELDNRLAVIEERLLAAATADTRLVTDASRWIIN